MQLSVDAEGLAIRADLDTEHNAQAAALYSACEREDISGMSFMFTVDDERWTDLEEEMPTRHIVKIGRVYEVSAVTFPAYDQTSITARDAQALESARAALENARAAAGTDERARKLKLLQILLEV